MKYLESVEKSKGNFLARFTSGATTSDLLCAQFFLKMQENGYVAEQASSYVSLGRRLQPDVDWNEIQRVLDTFDEATSSVIADQG